MAKRYYINHPYHPRRRRPALWFLAAAIVALVAVTAVVRHVYYGSLSAVSQDASAVDITIERGASVDQISTLLSEKKLIKSQWAFKLYVHNQDAGSVLQAGAYKLRANMSVGEIVAVLTHGKVVTDLVTITPGQTLKDVRETLINAGYSESQVDEALSPSTYPDAPILIDKPSDASLEGFLYPDSYQRDSNTTPQDIITEALTEMQQHLNTDIRNDFAAQGLSTYQGLILASMIEREVAHVPDKAQVAQVFLKRLHENVALGSDVTALYGAELAGVTPTVRYESAYNTLTNKGLPPTPIGAVSQSSLDAVAMPSNTDWMYFVAGDNGTTYFSRTLAEHEALTAQHCRKLCQ